MGSGRIESESTPRALGAYAHARRAGGLIFVAGLGPRRAGDDDIPGVTLDAHGRVVDHDIEVQARACLENLRTVLEHAGAGLEHVVDALVFLTHLERDFAAYNRVWQAYFGDIRPARTTIGVTALPQGGRAPIAIEIKAVAVDPSAVKP